MKISCKFWLLAICAMLAGEIAVRADSSTNALTTNQIAQSYPAATNSLNQFRRLITPSNYKLMGFASTNQVSQTVLGEPIQVYNIRMTNLTNYSSSQDFKGLLTPASRVIYPIAVKTDTVSSTTLRLTQNNWKTAGWGQSGIITNLTRLRTRLQKGWVAGPKRPDEIFAAEVPITGTWMVGYFDGPDTPVLFTSYGIVTNAPSDHQVSRHEMEVLANRARSYSGGSN
jgi:hypothetical protein